MLWKMCKCPQVQKVDNLKNTEDFAFSNGQLLVI